MCPFNLNISLPGLHRWNLCRLVPPSLPARSGMEEKRPQQLAATAGAASGQVHLQYFTARFLHKPQNSQSNTAKGKPRGDFGVSPLLLAAWLIKTKQETCLKLLSLPKTNAPSFAPKHQKTCAKTLAVLGEETCFRVSSVPENTWQMQGEHNWVSYSNTRFSLHSLDSTQNISKPIFDDCSRVDDCHLLWQLEWQMSHHLTGTAASLIHTAEAGQFSNKTKGMPSRGFRAYSQRCRSLPG